VREGVLSDFEKEDDPWTFEKEDEWEANFGEVELWVKLLLLSIAVNFGKRNLLF
jgi:hypothetical protein